MFFVANQALLVEQSSSALPYMHINYTTGQLQATAGIG